MLKTRIIPVLQFKNYTAIKTVNFCNERMVGDAITLVKIFSNRLADEMVILDLDGTQKRKINKNYIKRLSKECNMPLTVGGGIRTLKDAHNLFQSGADKIIINTEFYNDKQFIPTLVKIYGSQSIIFSLDVKSNGRDDYLTYSNGGRKKQTLSYLDTVDCVSNLGVGEILINNIQRDGKMQGYDLKLISNISKITDKPLIALGGCSCKQDFKLAFQKGASGFAAGSVFHWIGESILTIKKYLMENNVPVRLLPND